ncbi:MAG: biosynthetic-type acetolactate synthase large subunit [Paludibacteraceae bacterium]|nr:biosynthetic-type acetolactate synthase large subunit [Paludibacteraceae bacterium]MBP8967081.1 biosynthetic-type acetolactate synthase large subunit [Paludibacteraceae bacterium]HOF97965.1 biosynthetic-type acetolactate synthase large subunit [Paludibacteraceae bacterium]HOR38711.1 biosynthetic-type acetolactate synthase large subunit [Paludibacteraceae bacterium]HQG67520.1 biosynthetic-type acetolactate synthase large subunit [Paludibacteraceae bacterium]
MKMTGAKALIESLLQEGVETIFGYPGGAILPVFDALYDYDRKVNHILTRHEQGAAHAAEGYARVSGKVGVCLITSGPAATNAITGISDAMLDSVPLLVITGQVGASLLGTDAFQEIDVIGITQPITKWSYQIRRAEDVAWAVARAFYIASTGRPGPVVLDFTKNAQSEEVDFQYKPCKFIRSYVPVPEVNFSQIEKAAELINAAEKPFAVVGHGVILGQAEKDLMEFLEKADIPAAWTLLGASAMPSDFRLNKGFVGMHGNVAPNMKTNECDVLIAIGMRFDDRVTGDLKTYASQAKIIHIDIDAAELNKNLKVEVPVLGSVKDVLPALTKLVKPAKHTEWIDSFDIFEKTEYEKVIEREVFPKSGKITMGEVIHKVSEATQHNAICVTDVGQNQMASARYFKFSQSRSLITSGGLGTMGFGLPAAIGAKIAAPDRTVCLFAGDGGFQMTIQELGTIMENNIGVKMIVLDNKFLGMVRQWQELFYEERYSFTKMKNPDFVAIGKAYNIDGKLVNEREELDEAIADMLKDDRPYLLVVNVETKGMVYPMIPAGTSVTNIILE